MKSISVPVGKTKNYGATLEFSSREPPDTGCACVKIWHEDSGHVCGMIWTVPDGYYFAYLDFDQAPSDHYPGSGRNWYPSVKPAGEKAWISKPMGELDSLFKWLAQETISEGTGEACIEQLLKMPLPAKFIECLQTCK